MLLLMTGYLAIGVTFIAGATVYLKRDMEPDLLLLLALLVWPVAVLVLTADISLSAGHRLGRSLLRRLTR